MPVRPDVIKPIRLATALFPILFQMSAQAEDVFSSGDKASAARVASAPKTPAIKTITNFSQSLRCMDDLFLGFDKKGIIITSAGIPDETGKVNTGTKEMMITAISKMTIKSEAFEFIDFHNKADDLSRLFAARPDDSAKMPDFYIRGSITQMDDNAVRTNKGLGFALPFLDLGYSKDDAYDLISMDMSVGHAATRRILPETSTSNTMVISKSGRSGEAGGKVLKAGLSFNLDLNRSEGMGATTRTLLELGLIETLGKFTRVPYWKCLDIDSTNPAMMDQAREGFDSLKDKDRILFVQRKLGGSMNRYKGAIDGVNGESLKSAIAEYQKDVGLIADGRLNFDLYFSLLDDTQNQLAALPGNAPRPAPAPAAAAPASAPAAAKMPFQMRLESDRGVKPTYKVGEFLNMSLSLNSPGMVHCYYEDVGHNTARIFPNQFFGNPMLAAGNVVRLPSGGFKIKFDQPGRERVACIGDEREVLIPPMLKGTKDLARLQVHSLDEVIGQFKQLNPTATSSVVDITVR